jgi:signal transduction histidine kinase
LVGRKRNSSDRAHQSTDGAKEAATHPSKETRTRKAITDGYVESARAFHKAAWPHSIAAQKIHLVRNFSEGTVGEIYTGEILQVISNLLANALDAVPERGTISFRLRKRSTSVQLLVADNGRGMRPDHVTRLFEPFFLTRENRGKSLGLALSKKIVERHAGTISARSSALPRRNGTQFKI